MAPETTPETFIEPGPFAGNANPPAQSTAQAGAEAAPKESLPDSNEPAPAPAAASPAGDKPPVLYKGIQKEFTSTDEWTKYTMELERRTLEQEARLAGLETTLRIPATGEAPVEAPRPAFDKKAIGEEMILNPASAIDKIINHVTDSVKNAVGSQTLREKYFETLYAENEDLIGAEDLVEASVQRNSAKWGKLPVEKATQLLLADVRGKLEKIRGASGKILPSAPAHALPTGGNPAPRQPAAAAPAKPQTFTEQMKAQKARHVSSPSVKH